MLLHVFNDDNSISILTDLGVVIIENTHKSYDKIAENLNLRNWDLVKILVKNQ